MGRKDGEELSAAQIMYPCMQCADIFFLKADICQLVCEEAYRSNGSIVTFLSILQGMDQRKVNMLAREYCDVADPKIRFKPVIRSFRSMGLT